MSASNQVICWVIGTVVTFVLVVWGSVVIAEKFDALAMKVLLTEEDDDVPGD